MNKVLQPMETNDPYADDFYFLQLNIKKNNAARERAVLEQRPLPSAIYVPLPVWKETKERIKLQIEATRQSFHQKSREWEEKEMVRHVIMPLLPCPMHCMIDNWSNIYIYTMCLSLHRYRCKVLGHQVRSNIHRPREQLFVPSLRDFDFDGPDQDDDGEAPLVRTEHCYCTIVCPYILIVIPSIHIHPSISIHPFVIPRRLHGW